MFGEDFRSFVSSAICIYFSEFFYNRTCPKPPSVLFLCKNKHLRAKASPDLRPSTRFTCIIEAVCFVCNSFFYFLLLTVLHVFNKFTHTVVPTFNRVLSCIYVVIRYMHGTVAAFPRIHQPHQHLPCKSPLAQNLVYLDPKNLKP